LTRQPKLLDLLAPGGRPPDCQRLSLATTTTATRDSRRVAKLQRPMPQPILRPQRWAVYTPDQRRIDREPAYVVAVSELLTTPWIGLGRPFASALRHERGSGSPGLQQPKGNETTS